MAKTRKKTTSKTTAKKAVKKAVKKETPAKTEAMSSSTAEIRSLIEFISQTGLNEVDIETKDLKLHVKREPDHSVIQTEASASSSVPVQHTVPAAQPASLATTVSDKTVDESVKKTAEIKSPMIGTFYRSPNPDSPAFVQVGDRIEAGQTVCIIEAMKLFNEIESEISGTVIKVMVDNSTPVEYDQVLYLVDPD